LAEAFLALCRFLAYTGAAILFGSPLLLLYGSPLSVSATAHDLKWIKLLLSAAALSVLVTAILGFIAQTSHLAGSLALALQPESLKAALWDMDFGRSSLVRAGFAVLALIGTRLLPVGKKLWWGCTAIGAIICASFAWMGHGAATEGNVGILHLAGDITHILAAAGWIGALVVFSIMLIRPSPDFAASKAICASLASFSGAGTAFVAIIIASGLVNSAFLVGWNAPRIASTLYGQFLIAKLLLFALMLGLAARNRFRLIPALANALQSAASPRLAMTALRRSILMETCVAAGVLVLVAWLGMLEPVTT